MTSPGRSRTPDPEPGQGELAQRRREQATGLVRPWRRLALLAVTTVAGALVALAGWAGTGDERWVLAIPVALAAVWLRVADPTRCETVGDAAGDAANRRFLERPRRMH